ncbi:MAG: TolC family protein [Marinobacter sp.]
MFNSRSTLVALLLFMPLPETLAAQGVSLEQVAYQTLINNAEVRSADYDRRISAGRLQTARGAFDPVFEASGEAERRREPAGMLNEAQYGTDTLENNTYSVGLGVEQPLRSGLSLGVSTGLERTEDPDTRITPGAEPANYATVGFSLSVPLGQGLGADEVAAEERSLALGEDASGYLYGHAVSREVSLALEAYWSYRGAQQRLALTRDSEERARVLLEQTRKLVEADEKPRAELPLVRANLADKGTLRLSEEQNLASSRNQLGRAMGLGHNRISTLDQALDALPPITPQSMDGVNNIPGLVNDSLPRRMDLRASTLTERSAAVSLKAQRLADRPDIDLDLSMEYRSLEEENDAARAVTDHQDLTGPSVRMTLRWQWAAGNNANLGRITERQAELDKATLQRRDLRADTGAGIADAARSLANAAETVESSRESVESYRESVDNERKRYRLGSTTLINLLELEDRLVEARLSHIRQQEAYAQALTRLLFRSGQLITRKDDAQDRYSLQLERFYHPAKTDSDHGS